jgi:hypothetical protein
MPPKPTPPWYKDGLRFTCRRCGKCCGGAPGYVWVSEEEIQRIARYLGLEEREFLKRYCRRVFRRVTLREKPNYDCIFFSPAGCRIYEVRPHQCSSFPFWPDNIDRPASWEATRRRCPGCGDGKLYTLRQIEAVRDGQRRTE